MEQRLSEKMEKLNLKYTQNYRNAPIHMLNDDCMIHIFEFLPIADKVRIERVCKRWRVLSQESWSTMKILHMSHITWSTTVLRTMLIKCGRFLTHIDLSSSIKVPDYLRTSALTMIPKFCPNLTNINNFSVPIYPGDLYRLTKHCKKITRINLRFSGSYISDDDLKNVFRAYQHLNYFEIGRNHKISGECLLYLPVQTMRTLEIHYCDGITDVKMSTVLARLENLEYLVISTATDIDKTLDVIINHCKNLKKLEIYSNKGIQHIDMLQFANLVNLQVLQIPCFIQLSDNHLISVANFCPLITCIDISGCKNVSDVGLTAIATLPKLECLYMNYLSDITDLGLKNIANLRELECRNCVLITDNGICKILASSPELQKLYLHLCFKITNATYEAANEICDSRPSKIILTMFTFKTQIVLTDEHKVSPFLKICMECTGDM